MKKIIFSILLSAGLSKVCAQVDCVIPMMVLVPEQNNELSSNVEATLESKMRQLVTQNGMDGGAKFSNFSIVAGITENDKEILSGLRPLTTLSLNLELFVGNNFTGEKFASTNISLRGSGRTQQKAYSAAFAKINLTNKELVSFLTNAKKKVVAYYESQLPNIIRQAESYSVKREYEEALCLLSSVPVCCNKYDDVEKAMLNIWQEYVNYDCAIKLAKARAVWNAGQNKESALLAGAYLATIDPASSCYGEVIALGDEIYKLIGDEWEFYKELKRGEVALEQSRIEAMRAIGVAYGQNQKAKTISEHWIVR